MAASHPDFQVLKFTVKLDGNEERETQVLDNDNIVVEIPEGTEYVMTIHFHVTGNTLKDLKYKQVVKKGGITVRTREVKIGDEFEKREEVYTVTFDPDTTPSGMFFRGNFNCTSTYHANGDELYEVPWLLTVTKKG